MKQKNQNTIDTTSSLPFNIKKNLKDKFNFQIPLKIKKLEVKTVKIKENISNNINQNTQLINNENSKIQADSEYINTISVNSFNKDNNIMNKEISDMVIMMNNYIMNDNIKLKTETEEINTKNSNLSKNSTKVIVNSLKMNKNINLIISNEYFLDTCFNLLENSILRVPKYKSILFK